jgi:hypothetical protein
MKRYGMLCWAVVALAWPAAVGQSAETHGPPVTTNVVVRVVGNHALALGDTVGGAEVTIRDAETGAVLASGLQTGSAGDLRSIMQTPREHIEQVFSVKGAAAFTATLHLINPTLVEITGEGPLKFPQARRRTSKSVLLYPGQHVTGDGIVLDLNGLLVQIEAPSKDRPLGIGDTGTIHARVNMLCDCVVEPFGNWDSRKMQLYGEMRVGNRVVAKIDLYHQGPKGLFLGNYIIPRSLQGKEHMTLRIVASDAEGINVGYDEHTYPLVPWEQSRDATGREIPPIASPSP